MSENCSYRHSLINNIFVLIDMTASENLQYIKSLRECPTLYNREAQRIMKLRKELSENTTLSDEQRDCWLDLLDSATILTSMLLPFQNVMGLITQYRGVELFNFDQIFNCEPIGSLELYNFLRSLSDNDRKIIINRLTRSDELRGRLNLAVRATNPKEFLTIVAKNKLDKNILMGIYGLEYGMRFSQVSLIDSNSEVDIETAINYIFSRHEQMLLDLANLYPAEDDSTLIEVIVRIIKKFESEGVPFGENIDDVISIKKKIRPYSFRKICRNLTYLYVLGLYMTFDKNRFGTPEISVIRQILIQNQFREYGSAIRRKCLMMLSTIESYNRENHRYNSLKNTKPELAEVIEQATPFIEEVLSTDNTGQNMDETYGCGRKTNLQKLQILINALGRWGYINNDSKTKRLLYYRITGFARPERLELIEWHKDINVLFILIKTVLEKQKGKYDKIPLFFNTPMYIQEKGHESAYATRVKDENIKDLIAYLYKK